MKDIDKDLVWLVCGALGIVGLVVLCALGKVDGDAVSVTIGVLIKGMVDAMSHVAERKAADDAA